MGKLGDWTRRGLTAPLRLLLPKNPWLRLLVLAVPLVLVAAFLEPVLSLLGRGLELILRVLTPLLDNPTGRFVLLNVLLAIGLWLTARIVRVRARELRSGLLLRHHLAAVEAVVARDARASDLLRKVAASRAAAPREYPWAMQDAKLKLARCALDQGQAAVALGLLTGIRDKGLPKELLRSLLQLRVRAGIAQGDILDEPLERELRAALERFKDDLVLLRLLRQRLVARREFAAAAELQERIVAHAPKSRVQQDRQVLAGDLLQAGEAALQQGDTKAVLRFARAADRIETTPAVGCLIGRVRLAENNPRAAVAAFGATRSSEGLGHIAELLEQRPGAVTPRELLELCPTEGALLLAAREYARAGESGKALRTARRAARALGPTPTVTAVLAEVLVLCGQPDQAAALREEGALRLLNAEGVA